MDKWQWLQDIIGEWSDERFGKGRTPHGNIEHLKEEVVDLKKSAYDPHSYSDCFILLINAARLAGFSMEDIYQAIIAKNKINIEREWEEEDENGITRHKK